MILPKTFKTRTCGKCGNKTLKKVGTDSNGNEIWKCSHRNKKTGTKCPYILKTKPLNNFTSVSNNEVCPQSRLFPSGNNNESRSTRDKTLLQGMLQGNEQVRDGVAEIEGFKDRRSETEISIGRKEAGLERRPFKKLTGDK